jgi:hypothetical protein
VASHCFAFARAISSFTELTGTDAFTHSTVGAIASSVIGAKSFTGSYPGLLYRLGAMAWVAIDDRSMV